jgi:hypothetical protein
MGVVECSGEGHDPLVTEGPLARMRFALSTGASGASLRMFEGGEELAGELWHRLATATVEWQPLPRWSFVLGLGVLGDGQLTLEGASHAEVLRLDPGPLATLGASYLVAKEGEAAPFVIATVLAGAGLHTAEPIGGGAREAFTAIDLRAGLAAGKTFVDVLRPYVAARVFGGPALLGDRATGTDRYHLQLAVGLSVVLPRGFDAFAELAPGPERAATFGIGFAPGR